MQPWWFVLLGMAIVLAVLIYLVILASRKR